MTSQGIKFIGMAVLSLGVVVVEGIVAFMFFRKLRLIRKSFEYTEPWSVSSVGAKSKDAKKTAGG